MELERIAARGWQGTTVRWLGDWLLRSASGFTGRANSVLPLGFPGIALDDALAVAEDFYAAQGLPLRFQVPVDAAGPQPRMLDELNAELDRRGFQTSDPVVMMTAELDVLLAAGVSRIGLPSAELDRKSTRLNSSHT